MSTEPAPAQRAAAVTTPRVVVSITFDDAIDDVEDDDNPDTSDDDVFAFSRDYLTDGDTTPGETACDNVLTGGGGAGGAAANEVVNCDLPAVYYVNWPRVDEINLSGANVKWRYLSTANLQSLQSWGHEIGGHSAHHFDIPQIETDNPTLDLDEQRLEVCWDRQRSSTINKIAPGTGTFLLNSFAAHQQQTGRDRPLLHPPRQRALHAEGQEGQHLPLDLPLPRFGRGAQMSVPGQPDVAALLRVSGIAWRGSRKLPVWAQG